MKNLYKLWAILAAIFMVGFVALSVNAQTNREVQVRIDWATGNVCTFGEYDLMHTGFSYLAQTLHSTNTPDYECKMEKWGTNEKITVKSNDLENPLVDPVIPAANVKIKHEVLADVSEWACTLSNILSSATYQDIAVAKELFEKDNYTVCTVTGSTKLEITVPASLPVWTYTGNITFAIY
jgi:hypothetical protein